MNSQNIYEKELLKESKEEFDKYIFFLNKDENAKKSFNYFLFDDIYKKMENNNNIVIELDDLSNSSLEIKLKNYLENILSKISDNNYLKDIKENLILTQKNIHNKISECNDHIKILKDEYKNIKIQSLLPINKSTKLIFEKKTVLHINKANIHNNILGEFFARYIFSSIDIKNNNIINNFYANIYIDSYIDNNKISSFSDTHQNFKYWIILLNLIKKLFDTKSDYEIIFNYNKLKEHITNVLKKEIPKKDKKNKGKKQYGGKKNNRLELAEKLEKNNKKKEKVKNTQAENLKNYYKDIFKNSQYHNIKLIDIYYESFKKNMKTYFEYIKKNNEDEEEDENDENENDENENDENEENEKDQEYMNGGVNIYKIEHPFKKNYKIDDKEISEFDIFQYLYELQQNENEEEITIFISNIKYKTILILYYLYILKKNIYTIFIRLLNSIFNIPKLDIQKSDNIPKLNIQKSNNKTTQKNIEKIEILQKQNFASYSYEFLKEYENIQKKLIKKYYKEHNININQ